MNALFRTVGQTWLGFAVRASLLALRVPEPKSTLVILTRILVSSLPVVGVVAFFSGAMLTVQAEVSLALVGGGPLAGTLVGLGGVREVFPLLGAASLAARTGAEYASELSAMKGSEQLDAIEVMGLDPLRLLVAPRILACAVAGPMCVVFADGMGLFGAQSIATLQLSVDPGSMWNALTGAVVREDLYIGAAKGVILGWLIGIVTTWEGFMADKGAQGVGEATNRGVVRAMIAACIASLLMTAVIYGQGVVA